MRIWIVLLVVLLLLAGLSLVRVGGEVAYGKAGLSVRILAGPLRIRLYPFPKRRGRRAGKRRKASPPAPKPAETDKKPVRDTLRQLRAVLPVVARAAGALRRKIRIDRLSLSLTAAAPDPALAAMAYGGAWGLVGMLLPILEQGFDVRERDVRVTVDYQRSTPRAEVQAAATMTVGQGALFALKVGLELLGALREERTHPAG